MQNRAYQDVYIGSQAGELIYICVFLLKNLSLDETIEKKLIEKVKNLVSCSFWSYSHLQSIFSLLAKLLKTSLTDDMVSLCLSFLARVSIRREAVEQMRDGDFIAILVDQIDSKDTSINLKAKSLAYNLAFEPVVRQTMIESGLIAKVGACK